MVNPSNGNLGSATDDDERTERCNINATLRFLNSHLKYSSDNNNSIRKFCFSYGF